MTIYVDFLVKIEKKDELLISLNKRLKEFQDEKIEVTAEEADRPGFVKLCIESDNYDLSTLAADLTLEFDTVLAKIIDSNNDNASYLWFCFRGLGFDFKGAYATYDDPEYTPEEIGLSKTKELVYDSNRATIRKDFVKEKVRLFLTSLPKVWDSSASKHLCSLVSLSTFVSNLGLDEVNYYIPQAIFELYADRGIYPIDSVSGEVCHDFSYETHENLVYSVGYLIACLSSF